LALLEGPEEKLRKARLDDPQKGLSTPTQASKMMIIDLILRKMGLVLIRESDFPSKRPDEKD
jgi:hypothetical protein